MYREVRPFVRSATNTLAHLASYVVLVTYGGGLAIATDLDKNLNPVAFGSILLGVNLAILLAVLGFGAKRHAEGGQWHRELTDDECQLLDALMDGGEELATTDTQNGNLEMTSSSERHRGLKVQENSKVLQQLLIGPH